MSTEKNSNSELNADSGEGEEREVVNLRALHCEQLLIDTFDKWSPRIPTSSAAIAGAEPVMQSVGLVVSPGRAQLAETLIKNGVVQAAHAWYLDLHDATQASLTLSESVEVLSGPDLPDSRYFAAAFPVMKRSESELTRELLQQMHQRLIPGGLLVTSVDNPRDTWLHEQLQSLFEKVTCERTDDGCVYWAKKKGELKKAKQFECVFEFRDNNRTIKAVSQPGVFSHRRLDPGAKQLMLSAEIGEQDNVLDMGTGCGAVALSVAFQTQGRVFGVDSNSRAVQCLSQGAELNGLENVEAIWNADGELELPVEIDLALANPPYFGDDSISQHFVETCLSSLRTGGALLVVTKQPAWYEACYDAYALEDIVIFEAGKYFVACGRKP